MSELIVTGGLLFDGSGASPRPADLRLADGRVAAIEPPGALAEAAGPRLDATEAWVAPGIVDIHTHYDLCLAWPGLTEHCLRQGITTVVGGNCGLGDADLAGVLARAEAAALGVHFACLAPLGPLRSRVVPRGAGRAASPAERPRVAAEVARALDAGAAGVSWGPYHANGLMDADELEAAVAVAAARGKPLCVHRRSEGAGGLAATREAIALAQATGARLQISHLKAAGRTHWGEFEPVLECVEAARRGADVGVDLYPYDASLTYLSAVVPDRLKADGGLLAALASGEGRAAAARGVAAWFEARQGPEAIVLLEPSLAAVPPGTTLAEAARRVGAADPVEAALRLIAADPNGTGGWAIYRHMMAPEQVEHLLDLPFAAVASDAVPEEDGLRISAHPRAFATFARFLARAADRGQAALADAVRRCTRYPAERLGLDRGRLEVGAVADLVVLRGLTDPASFAEPERYPGGVAAVVTAGEVALRDGALTGAGRGAVLRP